MTQEKQIDLLEQFHKDKMETLISKGKDYASKDDILSNFKNSGAIVGVSKERQILSLIATKVARLGNLLDNKDKPNNESIEDTVKDLSGYVDLMYCAFKENQKDIIVDLMNDAICSDSDSMINKLYANYFEREPKFTGILSQLKEETPVGYTAQDTGFKEGDCVLFSGYECIIQYIDFNKDKFVRLDNTEVMFDFTLSEFIELVKSKKIIKINEQNEN